MKLFKHDKLRVVILSMTKYGGAVHYASQLANALSQICDVTVVAPVETRRYFHRTGFIACPTLASHRVPSLSAYRQVYQMIKNLSPDIIHDPTGPQYCWTTPLNFLLSHKFPLVVTIHVIRPQTGMSLPRRWLHSLIVRINNSISNMVVVTGQHLVKDIVAKGATPAKVKVIPHGCISLNRQVDYEDENPIPTVLFFGALRFNKGIDRLINIANLVASSIPNVKFLVAGSLQSLKQLDETGKRRILSALETMRNSPLFHLDVRYIPDEDVPKLFRYAWVVVLPYRDASQSGIIGLAYNFSRPVVATNVGALSEIVDNGVTGFVVDPESDEGIAEALVKILQDENLRLQMGRAGRKKANGELSWNAIAAQTVAAYRSI